MAIAEVGVDAGSIGVELKMELRQRFVGGLANNGRNVGVREVIDQLVNSGGHGESAAEPVG